MKKIISLILAIMMMGSSVLVRAEGDQLFFTPGDEYKDVGSDEVVEELVSAQGGLVSYDDMSDYSVVGILNVLGIMGAYTENSFKPNVYISKGEFVEGVVKLMNEKPIEDLSDYTSLFYDVPITHEKAGYIYAALERKLIYGYDDNTFSPDSVMNYEEAASILLRALGYDEIVDSHGGYFVGYNKLASDVKLTKGFTIENMSALTRMDMANLLHSVLHKNILTREFTKSASVAMYKDGEVFINKYFDVHFNTGAVTTNFVTTLDNTQQPNKGSVVINGVRYRAENTYYNSLLGYKVDYYYNEDMDLVYAVNDRDVQTVVVEARDVDRYDPVSKTFYYVDENGRRDSEKLIGGFNLLYNGTIPTGNYDHTIFNVSDGRIVLISNDRGASYETVMIEEATNFVVDSVVADGLKATIRLDYEVPAFDIDGNSVHLELYSATGANLEVYKQNSAGEDRLDMSAVKKGTVLSIYAPWGQKDAVTGLPTGSYNYLKMVVSDLTLEGKASMYDIGASSDMIAVIDGVEYGVAESNYFDKPGSEKTYEAATFLMDSFGNIVSVAVGKSSGMQYGYLIRIWYDSGDEAITSAKILTTQGKVERYELGEKLIINGKRYKHHSEAKTELERTAKLTNPTFTIQQAVKFELNDDNKLEKLETVTASVGIANGYDSTHLNRAKARQNYYIYSDCRQRFMYTSGSNNDMGGAFFNPKVILQAPETETFDDTKFSKTSYGVLTGLGQYAKMDMFNEENLVPEFAIAYTNVAEKDSATGADGFAAPVMFNEKEVVLNEDDEILLKFSAVQYGGVADFYSKNLNLLDGVEKGTLLWLRENNGMIVSAEQIKHNGNVLTPEYVKTMSLTDTYTDSDFSKYYNRFQEVYSIANSSETEFVVQDGPYAPNMGMKRENRYTGRFMHKEWAKGGFLIYDENDGDPMARYATFEDLKGAKDYGSKSSKLICKYHLGAAIQYVFYNFD